MTAAHPEAARAARVRHDLRLRAANLTSELHDPLRADQLGLTLAAIHRDANVIAIGALVKAVRAGAAHVARLAAPPAAPRLTLAVDGLVLHRGGGLWSELVAGPWPTCALCDAPVERASITQDVARCATVVAVRCHGETRIVTGPASAGFVLNGVPAA